MSMWTDHDPEFRYPTCHRCPAEAALWNARELVRALHAQSDGYPDFVSVEGDTLAEEVHERLFRALRALNLVIPADLTDDAHPLTHQVSNADALHVAAAALFTAQDVAHVALATAYDTREQLRLHALREAAIAALAALHAHPCADAWTCENPCGCLLFHADTLLGSSHPGPVHPDREPYRDESSRQLQGGE